MVRSFNVYKRPLVRRVLFPNPGICCRPVNFLDSHFTCYQHLHLSFTTRSVQDNRYNHRKRTCKVRYSTDFTKVNTSFASAMSSKTAKAKDKGIPRPSASVIVISPTNEVLLLHRVHTSSSFPSAHVFPGGNVSPEQDGQLPPLEDMKRHEDGPAYRKAAIRELFEESGILLARNQATGDIIHVEEAERERGRHAIHRNETTFEQWLQKQVSSAISDIDGLVPFTHWITPTNAPRRFSTQMYLYCLPLRSQSPSTDGSINVSSGEVQVPTSDGGIEIMEAKYLPASEWLRMARANEIILFPPQFLLLHLISEFLDRHPREDVSSGELQERRTRLKEFIYSGNPPWTEKYISPVARMGLPDNRSVLTLDSAGPEMNGSGRKGEWDRVVLADFTKGVPRNIDIKWRKDVLDREEKSSL